MATNPIIDIVNAKGVLSVFGSVHAGTTFALKAKLYDLFGNVLKPENVLTIASALYKDDQLIEQKTFVVSDVVLPELQYDRTWTYDKEGYNFVDVMMAPTDPGLYKLVYMVVLKSEHRYNFVKYFWVDAL